MCCVITCPLSATCKVAHKLCMFEWLLVDSAPLIDHRGQFKQLWEEDLPLATLWKGSNLRLSESQMTHETLPQGGNPTTADEDEHRNSAGLQYLGQCWGLGSERYTVWWLHSFHKLQQWPAFSATVVARPGQSPFSPSLLSHCWNWTPIISTLRNDNCGHRNEVKVPISVSSAQGNSK